MHDAFLAKYFQFLAAGVTYSISKVSFSPNYISLDIRWVTTRREDTMMKMCLMVPGSRTKWLWLLKLVHKRYVCKIRNCGWNPTPIHMHVWAYLIFAVKCYYKRSFTSLVSYDKQSQKFMLSLLHINKFIKNKNRAFFVCGGGAVRLQIVSWPFQICFIQHIITYVYHIPLFGIEKYWQIFNKWCIIRKLLQLVAAVHSQKLCTFRECMSRVIESENVDAESRCKYTAVGHEYFSSHSSMWSWQEKDGL